MRGLLQRPAIIHLIGFPGTGKYTIAKHMAALQGGGEHRLVVVDNHYVSNPILGVMDIDGVKAIDPAVWGYVRKVRLAVMEAIRDLSPSTWSFAFTNVLLAGDPEDQAAPARVAALADARDAAFVPVRLHCKVDELTRRAVSPQRNERLKWTDGEAVRAMAESRTLVDVAHPNTLDLDVTDVQPEVAARLVLEHAAKVSA
ncbi:MAG: hypothetical protein AVDCRST_MAG50-2559 [uncultured Acidimicrobiales bacterium]|uniref:Uncharacterized protein n=1 Tax=uncultured Acidimicrobiales bacterium TaxID=310071 RepID=A0A6J4IEC7_9ACTN|nr:MAG: hypothetical protein AVDCRST_MAG50-2559 [uncultured Acidimicrobiales bacterium]